MIFACKDISHFNELREIQKMPKSSKKDQKYSEWAKNRINAIGKENEIAICPDCGANVMSNGKWWIHNK